MSYVNVGVQDRNTGKDIPTKAALKRAITENPNNVVVYGTSGFQPFTGSADDLVIGVKYSVTGPNPYNNRKWYATIEKAANGKITVK